MSSLAHGPRTRAFELVRRLGRDTVSFQGLESGYRYWFDGDDAVIAFVDSGSAWVAAGGPIAPADRIPQVVDRFVATAAAQQRRACFFAAEASLVEIGLPALQIGEQPVWRAADWQTILATSASLRYQLRRAGHKGVSVRRVAAGELGRMRDALDALGRDWLAMHRMAPMKFLVQLEPLAFPAERMLIAAERDGQLVGFASAVPVYARRRMFLEDLVRSPRAPNGTSELLVDAVMRAVTVPEVTLGLAPLAGEIASWLRFASWLGGPFYDFAGLRAFKAKLHPSSWEPVYLCAPDGSTLRALRDSLRAFAGGSLLAFARRTLLGRRTWQ